VKFSHIPLVYQDHHLKACDMASESGGGTSGCFPTAAVVLAKLGCMPQSIDQGGLAAIWDACMQTLAKCSSLQKRLQLRLVRQGSRTHQKECMPIQCTCKCSKLSPKQAFIATAVMRVKMSQLDRAGIELHVELCQAESKSANLMRHWYYHCRQQTLAYLNPTSNCYAA